MAGFRVRIVSILKIFPLTAKGNEGKSNKKSLAGLTLG